MLGGRYEANKKIESRYSAFVSKEVELFHGFDQLHNNRPVLIELFRLPESKEAQRLAIALWEREIRLTRKAMASSGGEILLQLLDAAIDKDSNSLYIILQRNGKSLEEWAEGVDDLWFLLDSDEKTRKTVWNMFKSLASGTEALHQARLIHRNINPDTIYYSERPGEDSLKISGFTWSLYLHNLNSIPERLAKKERKYSLFQPSESFRNHKDVKTPINPFSSEVFSIAMTLCFIFYQDFPDNTPVTIEDWEEQFNTVLDFLGSPNSALNSHELRLLRRCISLDPSERPRTVLEFKREIQKVLETFEGEDRIIENKLKVSWYNQPDSRFLADLGRLTAFALEEIMIDPDKWLSQDFQNAEIYATGIKDYPLVIINNKDLLFQLKPIHIKKHGSFNREILELRVIFARRRRSVLRAIQDKNPLAILKNGLEFATSIYERHPLSRWRELLAKAEKELQEKRDELTEEEHFVETLKIMLEGEKRLDNKEMLQFKKLRSERRPKEQIESATILVSLDLTRDMRSSEKHQVLDRLAQFAYENGGKIELSLSNTPSSPWSSGREWLIRKIHRRNLQCTIERPIRALNKALDEEGVIRPFEMNLSLSLYRRKDQVINAVNGNNTLLSAMLNPKITTFYLGLYPTTEEASVSNVLNTVPMFLVQGPPGTGKTWLASSVVAKILEDNPYARILISSKDHMPLNHLVEAVVDKLPDNLDPKPIMIRVMTPEREREYIASDMVLNYTRAKQTKKIFEKASEKIQQVEILSANLEKQWKAMIHENLSNPSLRWMDEICKTANIIFATATSSTIEWLGKTAAPYDWVIVEEAAKAYPLELLLPMNLGHRWLLIGDQNQLPPYMYHDMAVTVSDILDEDQAKLDDDGDEYQTYRNDCLTNIKLFEKLFEAFEKVPVLFSKEKYHPCFQLNDQWRLPPLISDMISEIFYNVRFKPKQSAPIEGHPFISPDFMRNDQLVWIDTPHVNKNPTFEEKRTPEGSCYNLAEIDLIVKLMTMLRINQMSVSSGIVDIVFLTPYSAQKEELSRRLASQQIEGFKRQRLSRSCFTVDSYQGRQADIVILSLVRNNTRQNTRSALGFLIEDERLNVMFSRVRKRMVVIGCSKQIERFKDKQESRSISAVYEYIAKHGKIVTLD